jgi:hypothetical protein
MKNLAKLFLQSKQQSGKTNPRESASTARKVGQMRNTVRQMTGYKKGGTMENPKKQDRRVGKYESKKNTAEERGRNTIRRARKTINEILEMTKGAGKELLGKQKGGVASPPARKAPKGLRKLMAARRRTKVSPMQMDRKKEGYRSKVEKSGGKVMFADEMDRLKGESKKSQKSRIKKGLKLRAGGLAMRGYGIAKRGH